MAQDPQKSSSPQQTTSGKSDTIVFGAGCFWCVEAVFERLDGVQDVVAGYAGGDVEHPTYEQVCTGSTGHAEVAMIRFDPDIISLAELLDVFWQAHNPAVPSYLRQYASLILYHDEEQRRLAEESKRREEARAGVTLHTEIVPLGRFYPAEDYHQKYELRGNDALLSALSSIYPNPDDLRDSTVAARVNGYLAGYGTPERLEAEREAMGLPPEAHEELARIVARFRR